MKTILKHFSKSFWVLALYLLGTSVFAQLIANSNFDIKRSCDYQKILNVSTGYHPATNSILTTTSDPSSTFDPLWRLINLPPLQNGSSLPPTVQLNRAYVIQRLGSNAANWLNNFDSPASEQPISAHNTHWFSSNNLNSMQPFRFVREFCLLNDDEINFDLRIKGDDAARVLLYEGDNPVPVFSYTTVTGVNGAFMYTPSNFGPGAPLNGWHYNQTHALSAGNYTLEIQMLNMQAVAMGATMTGILKSENEKEVLSNDQGCCDVGTIGVLKILDENCNGRLDPGEQTMQNVTFNLLNSLGEIIRTGTTDQFGELIFYNVPYGTYTVQEVVPPGYSPFQTNEYQVVIGRQQSHYLTFFNCPKEIEEPEPGTGGAFCCDSKNLIQNGNFENGNIGFYSDYNQNSFIYPGEYSVSSSAAAFGYDVTDHSFCTDSELYPNNQNYLLVNGKTQQNGPSVIWGTEVNELEIGAEYRICANFKNMPQCTFDILPNITIQAGAYNSNQFIINTSDDACDWQNVEFIFTANSSSISIEFLLDEMGNGDGNDLAIDDIGLFKMEQPELDITVQHQGSNNQIIASINSIDTADDVLPTACETYNWFVAEVVSFSGGNVVLGAITSGTAPNWNLTTTFPGYTFSPNMLYYIGFYTPECDCFKESLVYQLTMSGNARVQDPGLTIEQEQQIIEAIQKGSSESEEKLISKTNQNLKNEIIIYPNPSSGIVNFLTDEKINSIEIFDTSGKLVSKPNLNNNSVDVTQLMSGIYVLKFHFENGSSSTEKFIKK